jgi:hypothetical protein
MKSARDDAAAMRKSEVVRLREALLAAKRTHLIVEGDCWYSCPASGQSCNNEADSGSRKCDCGADEHNAAIDRALADTDEHKE